jgi:MFS family permease
MNNKIKLTVLISALGYFVDVYDIMLFSVVREISLADIGVEKNNTLDVGLSILNWQVLGLLLGGIIWGYIGDKKGRVKVLLYSILIYSTMNIANAFINNIEQYKICRFIAGIGLSGELGAGVTLVTELMKKEKRGIGTMIISVLGMLGAIFAAVISKYLSWREAYLLGGIMGFSLLFLRFQVQESFIFKKIQDDKKIRKGNMLTIIKNKIILFNFLKCILIGLPTYFVIGLLISVSPELCKYSFKINIPKSIVGNVLICTYIFISVFDIISSMLSQLFKARKIIIVASLFLTLIGTILLLYWDKNSLSQVYLCFAILGAGIGYWSVYLSFVSEQFGTNIRALSSSTIPNIIRGLLFPMTLIFQQLKQTYDLQSSLAIIGLPIIIIAIYFATISSETFNRDADFISK